MKSSWKPPIMLVFLLALQNDLAFAWVGFFCLLREIYGLFPSKMHGEIGRFLSIFVEVWSPKTAELRLIVGWWKLCCHFPYYDILTVQVPPLKCHIETNNCHIWKEVLYIFQAIVFGSYVKFQGGILNLDTSSMQVQVSDPGSMPRHVRIDFMYASSNLT